MTFFKRFISVCFTLIFAFSLFIPLVTAVDSSKSFDDMGVEEDLLSIYPDLSSRYPINSDDSDIYLVNFVEYGYTQSDGHKADEYGLYLYIYNPSRKAISSDMNKVQFGVEWSKDKKGIVTVSDYAKYDLTRLDVNDEGTLYKFKVTAPDSKMYYLGSDNSRRYDISGVELAGSDYVVEDYTVATSYTFSGYSKGLSSESVNKSTLKCLCSSFVTLHIDAHQVSYLTGDSSMGAGYSNQVNSVYFSVPNEIEEKYGNLFGVKYEYYHYYTSPIIVSDNKEFYDILLADRGIYADHDTWDYAIYCWDKGSDGYFNSGGFNYVDYAFHYGRRNKTGGLWVYYYEDGDNKSIFPKYLTSVIYDPDGWFEGEIVVTADHLQKYFSEYDLSYNSGTVNGYSADLFDLDNSEGYKVCEVNVNDSFSLASYEDVTNKFQRWKDYGLSSKGLHDETISNAKMIEKISEDILTNGTLSSSKNYLIDQSYISELKTFYTQSSLRGDNVYLLRYAYADNYLTLDTDSDELKAWDYANNEEIDCNLLMAQANVYLDFDIIHMSFMDEYGITIIPVVSDPTDGFVNIVDTTPSNDTLGEQFDKLLTDLTEGDDINFWGYFMIIFSILLLFGLIVLLIQIIPVLVSSISDLFANIRISNDLRRIDKQLKLNAKKEDVKKKKSKRKRKTIPTSKRQYNASHKLSSGKRRNKR